MSNYTRVTVRYTLLSLFGVPLLLAIAAVRGDVVAAEPLLGRMRTYGFGYVFTLLSFGAGLFIAGIVTGMIVAATLKLPRPVLVTTAVVTPTVLLPASILSSFFMFTTGVPVIHNGTPYVIAAAVAGLVAGLIALRPLLRLT